jgi:hypothetical protein
MARVVRRQKRRRVDVEGQEIADRVRILGAVQPVQARSWEMHRGVPVDLIFQPGHELTARRPVERWAAICRRHQPCAELADDLFPNLGIRRYSIKRMRLEVQTRDLLGLVVAVETIAVDDGRLPLAFIADQAAAGCECAGQRSSCE